MTQTMKGKNEFTAEEAVCICKYLCEIRKSDSRRQKSLRGKLRNIYTFFITDFDKSRSGFTAIDFLNLSEKGKFA